MDGPLTDLTATVGTYQFRSFGGEQQNKQGDKCGNRCAEGSTLTDLGAPSFVNSFAPISVISCEATVTPVRGGEAASILIDYQIRNYKGYLADPGLYSNR